MRSEPDDQPPPLESGRGNSSASSHAERSLKNLIGLTADSDELERSIGALAGLAQLRDGPTLQIKAYSDIVYLNYHTLGISLQLEPIQGYRIPKSVQSLTELNLASLKLGAVDVYNHDARSGEKEQQSGDDMRQSKKGAYSAFAAYPLQVTCPFTQQAVETLSITPTTTGKDFVTRLGEPDRKGGGEGTMGVWAEWTQLGLLAEFASSGLKAWEHGADATWKVVTLFQPGDS
ncbi:hypothetical protein OIO90_006344, partial [Microbotryomycetes sp. JL221]